MVEKGLQLMGFGLEGLVRQPVNLLFFDRTGYYLEEFQQTLRATGFPIGRTGLVAIDEHPRDWPVWDDLQGYFSGVHYGSHGDRVLGFQFADFIPPNKEPLLIIADGYQAGTYLNALCRTLEQLGRDFSWQAQPPTVAFLREIRRPVEDNIFRGPVTARNAFILLGKNPGPEHLWQDYVPVNMEGQIVAGAAQYQAP